MAHRKGAFEDIVEVASRFPWPIGLILGVASAPILHFLAVSLTPSRPLTPSDLGGIAAHGTLATAATILQWVIPPAFLLASFLSYLRRSQATTLLEESRDNPSRRIKEMSWREFEQLIGEIFRDRGYRVSAIGRAGADGGVDLVLTKGNQRTLVQCKHWKARNVGVKVVRELQGVIAAQGATGGHVVTSGTFTPEAQRFAKSCQMELIDGAALGELIREVESSQIPRGAERAATNPSLVPAPTPAIDPLCPNCRSTMILRIAKRGPTAGSPFWGCSQFPACRGTMAPE